MKKKDFSFLHSSFLISTAEYLLMGMFFVPFYLQSAIVCLFSILYFCRKITNDMKSLIQFILVLLISTATITAQENPTTVTKKKEDFNYFEKFRLGGYGEMAASYHDFDVNRMTPSGAVSRNRGTISIPRFILAFDYKFTSSWILGAEIEFEYGGTGVAKEIEWNENGEYETEVEKGGEVALEQFHITKLIHKAFNVRFGHLVLPVGITNAHHEPINFFGVYRPEGEATILPSTWHENGISFFGEFNRFDYEVMMVAGLDPLGFSNNEWIASGKQGIFEENTFTSPAFVGRLNYSPIHPLRIGGSVYYGKTAKNASKPTRTSAFDAPVTIFTLDAQYKSRNFIARANGVYGKLGDSYELSTVKKNFSSAAGYSRTNVAEKAVSYAAEAGYNVVSLFNTSSQAPRIFPFVRYEYYNSMEDTEKSMLADKRFKVSMVTAGLNYYALPNLVVKADYTHRSIGGGDFNSENTLSVGLAYIGWFLSK